MEEAPDSRFPFQTNAAAHAKLGNMGAARQSANQLLQLDPDFTVSGLANQPRFSKRLDLTDYLDALRAAGLPEK